MEENISVIDPIKKEKKKRNHEREEKSHKILALINGVGFLTIFFFSLEEPSILIKAGFLIGSLGNIATFIFWNRIKKVALPIVYLLDAILYATKGYKAHEHGSQLAYLFYYLVGFGHVIVGVLNYAFRGKYNQ
jgi:hypothetical protein